MGCTAAATFLAPQFFSQDFLVPGSAPQISGPTHLLQLLPPPREQASSSSSQSVIAAAQGQDTLQDTLFDQHQVPSQGEQLQLPWRPTGAQPATFLAESGEVTPDNFSQGQVSLDLGNFQPNQTSTH